MERYRAKYDDLSGSDADAGGDQDAESKTNIYVQGGEGC